MAAPAMRLAARRAVVPPYRDPACLPALLALCQNYAIGLIVPTIDSELGFFSKHRDAFAAVGCTVMVSSADAVLIGSDKVETHRWLRRVGFPTVRQAPLDEFLSYRDGDADDMRLPLILKPRFGSSSIGVSIAAVSEALRGRAHERDLLVQTIASGDEYTVDVFIDRSGQCRCAVPRRRIETRAGEVSKGVTVREPAVINLAVAVAEALPGAFGVLNVQLFHDRATGERAVIEINPRFGGGYPLSHAAGAPMTRWVMEEVFGMPSTARDDVWRDALAMLRYDEAVFVDASDAGMRL
jgi:carbamoyl-phosphate synthase large subunit